MMLKSQLVWGRIRASSFKARPQWFLEPLSCLRHDWSLTYSLVLFSLLAHGPGWMSLLLRDCHVFFLHPPVPSLFLLWLLLLLAAPSVFQPCSESLMTPHDGRGNSNLLSFSFGSAGKESTCNSGDLGLIPGLGRSLEKGKATHYSILAWRIPRTIL